MKKTTVTTTSPEETVAFGKDLAKDLRPGTIIALEGPLGAGKTTLARGIARGLGIEGPVTSPTFILVNAYGTPPRLYHIDLYRLDRPDTLEDLGLDDILGTDAVSIIEWADKFNLDLPETTIRIRLDRRGENEREITVT